MTNKLLILITLLMVGLLTACDSEGGNFSLGASSGGSSGACYYLGTEISVVTSKGVDYPVFSIPSERRGNFCGVPGDLIGLSVQSSTYRFEVDHTMGIIPSFPQKYQGDGFLSNEVGEPWMRNPPKWEK